MNDDSKMDLRPKRRPKYLAPDESDPDRLSYSRPNYLKMNTTTLTQDYLSPSAQLNQTAKLLLKFLNNSNKLRNDVRPPKLQPEKQTHKNNPAIKEKTIPQNSNSKRQTQNKTQKPDSHKKDKELYKFKELHQNTQLIKALPHDSSLKPPKNLQNISTLINNKGIYSGPLANQLSQLQSLLPSSHAGNGQDHNLEGKQKEQSTKSSTKGKTQQKGRQSGSSRKQKMVGESQQNGSRDDRGAKLFKRSAYHVAIAYHIYISNQKKQGKSSQNDLDPTYRARMVREGKNF